MTRSTSQVPALEDLGDIHGRTVLARVDFNVPIVNSEITDDLRIRAALPTISWLQDAGAHVTACTHLGRPTRGYDPRYDVEPVRERFAELAPGVELLDNLRFDPGEAANDPAFVQQLIKGHDAYVNDAFGASHRPHASIVGPPRFLPSAAGRLLHREVEVLTALRERPRRPFVAVLGGSKVSDKLAVIEALLEIVDSLIVGGAMCFSFLRAKGHAVGSSLCEPEMVDTCRELLDGPEIIHLPYDITALGPGGQLATGVASSDTASRRLGMRTRRSVGGESNVRHVGADLPDGWTGVDIGPGSAALFGDLIRDAGTVLWNGPMGVFEDPRFAAGTKAVASAMADTKALTVIGGGDSAAAARQFGVDRDMDHVSTGGGASLELIKKGDLPGLKALRGAPGGS